MAEFARFLTASPRNLLIAARFRLVSPSKRAQHSVTAGAARPASRLVSQIRTASGGIQGRIGGEPNRNGGARHASQTYSRREGPRDHRHRRRRHAVEAATLLARKRIGAVVVRDEAGALAGILSERDVVRAVAKGGVSALAAGQRLYDAAVATCSEADSVEDLMEMMTLGRFRHVPVVDGDRISGIVSIGDVVKTRIAETVRKRPPCAIIFLPPS